MKRRWNRATSRREETIDLLCDGISKGRVLRSSVDASPWAPRCSRKLSRIHLRQELIPQQPLPAAIHALRERTAIATLPKKLWRLCWNCAAVTACSQPLMDCGNTIQNILCNRCDWHAMIGWQTLELAGAQSLRFGKAVFA